MLKQFVRQYANWIVHHAYTTIILALLFVGAMAFGAQHLSMTNDYRMFFDDDDPHLVAFESLQETYAKNDNVLFVLAPRSGDVFSIDTLSAIELLTDRAWQIPYSSRVDSLTNFQHSRASGDDITVTKLVPDATALDVEQAVFVEKTALEEPLLVDRLVSSDGTTTGINVTIQLPGLNEGSEVIEVANAARQIAAEVQTEYPNLDIHLTGLVMMNIAFAEASETDIKTLIPIMIVVVLLGLGLLLGAVWGTVAALIVIFASIAAALGAAGWLSIPLSSTSLASPNIILTISVAYSVHIMMNLYQRIRLGTAKLEAIKEALVANFIPLAIASGTTIIGFLSMNASDAPPFRHLGNITAIGVAVSFVLSLSLVPAFLAVMPFKARGEMIPVSSLMEKFADWVIKHHRKLTPAMIAIGIALTACIPLNKANDEFIKYFDDRIEFRRATDFAVDNLTGIYYVDFSLGLSSQDQVTDPEFLAATDSFSEWLRQQPEVMHVFSIADVFKRINSNMNGDEPGTYALPTDTELAAQYLFLYEMSLPYGLDLNDRLEIDKTGTRLTATLKNLSSLQVIDLEERAQSWLQSNAPTVSHAPGVSPTVMFAHIGQRNIRSMLIGVIVALVLISILLIACFRSVKIGLLSLVPNLLPIAMGFGLWGLLSGQVGLALSVVAAMTLGIVVDDTVHFLSKYLKARREDNMSKEDSIRYAFITAGSAILITTLVLMAGFGVLTLSSFEINSVMGLLTLIVIGLALVTDFLLLPSLLLLLKSAKDKSDEEKTPIHSKSIYGIGEPAFDAPSNIRDGFNAGAARTTTRN